MPNNSNQPEKSITENISANDFLAKYPLIDRTTTISDIEALAVFKSNIVRLANDVGVVQVHALPATVKLALVLEGNDQWTPQIFEILRAKNIVIYSPLHLQSRDPESSYKLSGPWIYEKLVPWLEAGINPNRMFKRWHSDPAESVLDIVIDHYGQTKDDEFGPGPLGENKFVVIIKQLLTYGANPNFGNNSYASLLFRAIHYGILEAAILLLDYGADVNYLYKHSSGTSQTPLLQALFMKNSALARMLINYGADVNKPSLHPPLFEAIALPPLLSSEMVKLLLENGAKIDQKDQRGRLPSHFAMLCKNDGALKLLYAQEKLTPINSKREVARRVPSCEMHPLIEISISGALRSHPSYFPKKTEPKSMPKAFSFFNCLGKRSMSTVPSAHSTCMMKKPFKPRFFRALPPPVLPARAIITGVKLLARR